MVVLECVDAGPFKCFPDYCSVSSTVDCDILSQYFCSYRAEAVWDVLPHASMSGRTIGDLCPESCNLCSPWCSIELQQAPSAIKSSAIIKPSAQWSPNQLAASRGKQNNNSCVAAHWVDAVRKTSKAGPKTRTTLAKALLTILEDKLLHLSSCSTVPPVCLRGKLRVQSWTLEALRQQPAQTCPRRKHQQVRSPPPELMGTDGLYIRPSAEEISVAALMPSTQQLARRALRRAGLAAVVEALGESQASELREELLAKWHQLKPAPILEASYRHHVMLEPDMPAVARALTALGVRADTATGKRRGLLAHIVPDGASITELASIIVRAGAEAQGLHSDTESHYGDATMTTAFVVLQPTAAELGALHFVPGSHTIGTREPDMHCGSGEPALNGTGALRALSVPAGTALLMDSRLLHHGGAHSVFQGSAATAGGYDADTTARVVFYFSWVNPRTASTSFLPMGSTYAMRGELWGRMRVPLQESASLRHHPMHASSPQGWITHDRGEHWRGWSILDLVTARIELCTRGTEWNVNVALRCLHAFGAANAATLFVRHREHELAELGMVRTDWCAA